MKKIDVYLARMILIAFMISMGACSHPNKRRAIDDTILKTFKIPYDSYCKITILANLNRIRKESNDDLAKSISLMELQLVTDLAYLNFVISAVPEESDYAKYVMNKIVYGLRNGYIDGGDNINSDNLLVSDTENGFVNVKEIYENVIIPSDQQIEFKEWYRKYFANKNEVSK